MAKRIELIFENDCPEVDQIRQNLEEAFHLAGLRPLWIEWEKDDPQAPSYVRKLASPTLLINGRDLGEAILGEEDPAGGEHCRLYRGKSAIDVEALYRALIGHYFPERSA